MSHSTKIYAVFLGTYIEGRGHYKTILKMFSSYDKALEWKNTFCTPQPDDVNQCYDIQVFWLD